jgi:hypothetical protein
MRRGFTLFTVFPLLLAVYYPGCDPQMRTAPAVEQAPIDQLWRAPQSIAAQDLFNGPWGDAFAPDPAAPYRFMKSKTRGVNPGMTVVDPAGRKWSVKQASHDGRAAEGPIEVVLSRVLSAVGYHQPPVYHLPAFQLADTFGVRTEPGGRFRLAHGDLTERGEWMWQENPFVGTKPYQGLLVILLMFNSSDLKNSNNTIYEHATATGSSERWYVVRDLGTALGTTARVRAARADPDLFAAAPFLTGIAGGYVQFGYDGWHDELLRDRITPADVRWASALLGQLTDTQWRDAFRAGGFDPATAGRFIARLREKVVEGLALADSPAEERAVLVP